MFDCDAYCGSVTAAFIYQQKPFIRLISRSLQTRRLMQL